MELKKVPTPPLHLLPRPFPCPSVGGEASCSSRRQRLGDFDDLLLMRYRKATLHPEEVASNNSSSKPLEEKEYISSEGKKSLKKEEDEIISISNVYATLHNVREAFLGCGVISSEDLETLIEKYENWVKEPLYLVFENGDGEKLFRLASKRGNSVYAWEVRKRLEEATKFFNTKEFKKLLLRKEGHSWVSNVLEIVLTTDTKRYGERKYIEKDISGNKREIFIEGDRVKAWRNIQPEYNRFITSFRKKYGKAWTLKTIESSERGYPHVNIIIITEKSWKVHSRRKIKKENGKIRWITEWRLGKDKNDREDKDGISRLWHSFVDIKCPGKIKTIRNYIFKDFIKQYTDIKKEKDKEENGKKSKKKQKLLSLVLNWLFRKRSFSISGRKLLYDLIKECITQTENTPKIEVFEENWKFLGLVVVHFSKDPPFLYQKKLSEELEKELNEALCRGC